MTLEKTIKNYIFDMKNKYAPEVSKDELYDNGNVYYMNGNDGTDFDWRINKVICPFCIFYKKSPNLGFIRVLIHKNGRISGYLYKNNGLDEPIELDEIVVSPGSVSRLKHELLNLFDGNRKWNSIIFKNQN